MYRKSRILVLTSAVVVSLPWWGFPGWLLLFGFVAILLLEESNYRSGSSVLNLFPDLFLFFLIWNIGVCWWMARIHILGGISVLILNSSIMTGVFLLYAEIRKKTGGGRFIFIFIWLSFEYLHHYGDLSWPWLSLGNGLAQSIKIVQWYEFTGMEGGTLWILLVNVSIASFIISLGRVIRINTISVYAIILGILFIVPPAISLRIYKSTALLDDTVDILIIQTVHDPYTDKFDNLTNLDRISNLLSIVKNGYNPDIKLIVTPETVVDSVWVGKADDEISGILFKFLSGYPQTKMLLGATSFKETDIEETNFTSRLTDKGNYFDIYNSAILYSNDSVLFVYDKHILANGVEQIPFQKYFPFFGRLSINMGGVSGSLRAGEGNPIINLNERNIPPFSTLICFESAYGNFNAEKTVNGAAFIVVMSNDGWFKNTGAYRQHLLLSGIRAIESRRTVVRSANGGVSGMISHKGEIVDKIEWWQEGFLHVKAGTNSQVTFFAQYGNFIGRISLFFTLLLIVNYFVRRVVNN